jgi:ribosomal protein S18 acetylase RimI-like enzyme
MPGVDEMHLLNITIAPAARRRGHARRLLAELVQLCRLRQASRLWLEVRESNAQAREAYGGSASRRWVAAGPTTPRPKDGARTPWS